MELKKEDSLFLFVNNGKELLKSGINKNYKNVFLKNVFYIYLFWLISKSIYFLILDSSLASVYEKYKDKDGFLYIDFSENQTFGWNKERNINIIIKNPKL